MTPASLAPTAWPRRYRPPTLDATPLEAVLPRCGLKALQERTLMPHAGCPERRESGGSRTPRSWTLVLTPTAAPTPATSAPGTPTSAPKSSPFTSTAPSIGLTPSEGPDVGRRPDDVSPFVSRHRRGVEVDTVKCRRGPNSPRSLAPSTST